MSHALQPRPRPRPPSRSAQAHAEAAGLVEHGAERAAVHLGLVCVPGLGGQADAGVGVRGAPRAPGPQVHCLLEAHPDLGAKGDSARVPLVSPAPGPSPSPQILWACRAGPSPPGFQSRTPGRAAGAPTAGLPPGWTPHRPLPAAPGVDQAPIRALTAHPGTRGLTLPSAPRLPCQEGPLASSPGQTRCWGLSSS